MPTAGVGSVPALWEKEGVGTLGLGQKSTPSQEDPASSKGSGAREGRSGLREVYAAFSLTQVPVQSWFDDMADTELLNLIPIFEELSGAEDVYTSLGQLRAP